MTNDNKIPANTGALYRLCAAATASLTLLLISCSPTYESPRTLLGNEILMINYNKAINMNLFIAKYRDKRYDIVLSKNNSGRASRDTLAFYVANARIDSQIYSKYLDAPLKAHKSAPRKQSLMQASLLPNDYEGKTSLNKIAERRISGAVAIVAESDSSHPIFAYSVIPTQKTIGAIHHG